MLCLLLGLILVGQVVEEHPVDENPPAANTTQEDAVSCVVEERDKLTVAEGEVAVAGEKEAEGIVPCYSTSAYP